MKSQENKKKILGILKKEGELPTTKIAHLLRRDAYYVWDLLEELKQENKLKSRTKNKFVYWRKA